MWHALAWLCVLNAALLVDCARHGRPAWWYPVLLALGPVGAAAYVAVHWETITFPLEPGRFRRRRRCSRCDRQVDRLHRTGGSLVCRDCQAEVPAL